MRPIDPIHAAVSLMTMNCPGENCRGRRPVHPAVSSDAIMSCTECGEAFEVGEWLMPPPTPPAPQEDYEDDDEPELSEAERVISNLNELCWLKTQRIQELLEERDRLRSILTRLHAGPSGLERVQVTVRSGYDQMAWLNDFQREMPF